MTAPCLRGHTEGRFPSGKCRACQREAMRKYRGTTAEAVAARRAERAAREAQRLAQRDAAKAEREAQRDAAKAARPAKAPRVRRAPVVVAEELSDEQQDQRDRAEALARIDEWLAGFLAQQRKRMQHGLIVV
jgi:hypothetical protein